MSLLDRFVAAVTPPEREQARMAARAKAREAAGSHDWLAMILDHHIRIEEAFAGVKIAQALASRRIALKSLSLILTGHSNAEESVIYPALIRAGQKSHAMAGYTEQAGAKANLGALEFLDPMTEDFMDKLEHIRGAVLHHMYEEESDRFLDLRKLSPREQQYLTERFREEFERYVGGSTGAVPGAGSSTSPTPGASTASH
ncbi:MAG TPA: hemerythrin domain-containing protein [Steroidobacteraceae bacterium]|nr:hemerythrin domain-containing protein [Steroidobacteraceae bacterium]